MKLTLDQIKSVTTGALRVEQEADGIHFYKCTGKQIAFWYGEREVLGERALCTTGVLIHNFQSRDIVKKLTLNIFVVVQQVSLCLQNLLANGGMYLHWSIVPKVIMQK